VVINGNETSNDRRSKHRFALKRELRYKILQSDRIIGNGTGQTVDISSGGVAFEYAGYLKQGALIELSISWPVLLDETCLMRLIICGRVVRAGKRTAACTIDRYEFRTQARASSVANNNDNIRLNTSLRRWAGSLERLMVRA
jgi:hypothetical protein